MEQDFLNALAEVIREQITHKKEIKIEGLGVFRHEHRKQFQQQYDDGRVVMMPPKDMIKFIPED